VLNGAKREVRGTVVGQDVSLSKGATKQKLRLGELTLSRTFELSALVVANARFENVILASHH
jgi:hypothetical protein